MKYLNELIYIFCIWKKKKKTFSQGVMVMFQFVAFQAGVQACLVMAEHAGEFQKILQLAKEWVQVLVYGIISVGKEWKRI